MVYDTQIYWGSGPCPLSGIKKLEHDVVETDPVSKTLCSSFSIPDNGQGPEPQ
jgi:hypothetical protein